MQRNDLDELHYIAPIGNAISICRTGILSHRRAEEVDHESVAMERIQRRRAVKVVPGARPLHDYVNLYVNARNKMLFSILGRHEELCVLRVSPRVLDIPDTIVTDRNASSSYARFEPAPTGLKIVDHDMVFADYWTHPDDAIEEWIHGSIMCAEVLVPDQVGPGYLLGAYVSGEPSLTRLNAIGADLAITINRHLFFQ